MKRHSGFGPAVAFANVPRRTAVFAPLRQWLLLILLLALIAASGAVVFGPNILDLYVQEVVAPQLERDLGFQVGRVKVLDEGRQFEVPGLIAVDPHGVFGRAGLRAGDIPVGYAHHGFVGFYHHLNSARGRTTTIRVTRAEAFNWTNPREVTVPIPVYYDPAGAVTRTHRRQGMEMSFTHF